MNERDRGFYIALAVSVVAISILGNAYHAYRAAIAVQESIDGGGDLGLIPLAPAIAAAIAIIPPALVLAFTHGITILVKAVGTAYATYRAIVENATESEDSQSTASDLTVGRGPIRVPQPCEKFAHNIADHRESDLDVDATTADAKACIDDAIADYAEPFFVDETMNDLDEILDSQDTAAESPARRDAEEAQADTDADIDDLMSLSARSNPGRISRRT